MITCYFITLHHKAAQFSRLWHALYNRDDLFCIHVDRKASISFKREIAQIVGISPNVILMPSQSVTWGGWSLVQVELDAMNLMLAHRWTRWVNLSGQDYPLKSISEIRTALASETNHVSSMTFAEIARTEPNDPHLARRLCTTLRGHIRRFPMRLPLPVSWQVKGSGWHMLTRGFVLWGVQSIRARFMAAIFRFTYIPDETYWQALIAVSPYANTKGASCGRFVMWPGPKTLTLANLDKALASDALFARKVDQDVDARILDALDQITAKSDLSSLAP